MEYLHNETRDFVNSESMRNESIDATQQIADNIKNRQFKIIFRKHKNDKLKRKSSWMRPYFHGLKNTLKYGRNRQITAKTNDFGTTSSRDLFKNSIKITPYYVSLIMIYKMVLTIFS